MGNEENNNPAALLTSNSAITPGVSGGLTMLICNTVGPLLGFPIYIVGVAISMMLAALIDMGEATRSKKAVMFSLNSLVIFSVAFGANGVGQQVVGGVSQQLAQVNSPFSIAANAQSRSDAISEAALQKAIKKILGNDNMTAVEKVEKLTDFNKSWETGTISRNSKPSPSPQSMPRPQLQQQLNAGFFKSWN